jgi:DNA-binding NarL/FixJ family response regulator
MQHHRIVTGIENPHAADAPISQPHQREPERVSPRVVTGGFPPLFKAALHRVLHAGGLQVAGHGTDTEDVIRKVAAHTPDLALVAGTLQAVTVRRRCPGLPIVVLADGVGAEAAELIAEGPEGIGYLLEQHIGETEEFVVALRRVARGGSMLDSGVVTTLLGGRVPDSLERLTRREREVLALLAEGRSNRGIARRLFVSEFAIEKHVGAILSKLGLAPARSDHRRVLAALTFIAAS